MAKYSFEFKRKVVQAYLNGEGGYIYLSKKYRIPSMNNVQKWVSAYKEFGEEGLLRSRKNKNYTFEFKLHVVELYLTTEVSYQELALKMGMNNPSLIVKWVNDYRIAGPEALMPKKKGRKKQVSKLIDKKTNVQMPNSGDTEYLKQLEEENLKLRIENAYLKELRRLRLSEEAQKRKQELSATSEDYSD